jgi:hypothetical protein
VASRTKTCCGVGSDKEIQGYESFHRMSPLEPLRRQIVSLHRWRSFVRGTTGWAGAVIAACWILAGLFVLDVVFELDVPQRLVVMVIGAVGAAWAWRRYSWPLLRQRESLTQVALLVERQHGIRSDLVAALQFESPAAVEWGSRQLEAAVISQVADRSRDLKVGEGFSHPLARRRIGIFLLTAAILVAAVGLFPEHARIFARRLALAADHYPSATRIEAVLVNDRIVLDRDVDRSQPRSIAAAEGLPIVFRIHVSGRLPEGGQARLRADTGRQRTLVLERLSQEAADAHLADRPDGSQQSAVYEGRLSRLVDPVSYRLYLGDAWTDPAEIRMIPLPVIELAMTVRPPEYAASAADPPAAPGSRQLSVLEGSEVRVSIESTNRKKITSAWVTITDQADSQRFEMQAEDATGFRWTLPPQNTPLERIRRETRFEVQLTDDDGLHLETPLRGYVRIKIDRPPTCSADIVHRVVLPTAKPEIRYRVSDDYGIAGLALHVQVERTQQETDGEASDDRRVTLELLQPGEILTADRMPHTGRYSVDLSRLPMPDAESAAPLALVKGDRLKLTLEATDYRGAMPGETSPSEPLVLEISDESGVLAAISEADERSEERLTEIIKQQLGIGETP